MQTNIVKMDTYIAVPVRVGMDSQKHYLIALFMTSASTPSPPQTFLGP